MNITEGEWTYHLALHEDGRNNGSVIAGAETGRAVCICKAPQFVTPEQWETNARLIAASPRLRRSLTRLVEHYVQLVNSGDCGNWDPEEEEVVRDARAALDQANGPEDQL